MAPLEHQSVRLPAPLRPRRNRSPWIISFTDSSDADEVQVGLSSHERQDFEVYSLTETRTDVPPFQDDDDQIYADLVERDREIQRIQQEGLQSTVRGALVSLSNSSDTDAGQVGLSN